MTQIMHCYENAQAERVNGILKQEYGLGSSFKTKALARKAKAVVDKIKAVRTGRQGMHQDVPESDVLIERAEIVEWENRLRIEYLMRDALTGARVNRASSIQVAVDMRTREISVYAHDDGLNQPNDLAIAANGGPYGAPGETPRISSPTATNGGRWIILMISSVSAGIIR